ncbi:hypothetical protein CCHR01_01661 [Colletotrichum chrysophilum]|uniref:Uncharacterized protein n=1 Tax=Colletotrichum chrysophilum TaxID=1836956 RepID=A0AAD9EQ48_9PEZI|nr:hypothetical protein CCHR01_01661 [Colletotrichum chrysophilum]
MVGCVPDPGSRPPANRRDTARCSIVAIDARREHSVSSLLLSSRAFVHTQVRTQ